MAARLGVARPLSTLGRIELELQTIDGVHNAYVVGLPDRERGQLVVAAVVAREGVRIDLGTIEANLRQNLSSYKVPRAFVEIARDEVPMLHSNKIARRQIEELLAEKLGRTAIQFDGGFPSASGSRRSDPAQ